MGRVVRGSAIHPIPAASDAVERLADSPELQITLGKRMQAHQMQVLHD